MSTGPFVPSLAVTPTAALTLFGLSADPDFAFMERMVEEIHSSCLFVLDSGTGNFLA